jgi:hypothetical protein
MPRKKSIGKYERDLGRIGIYENEVSIDISFSALFTTVTLFFVGLLIKEFPPQEYGICSEIPILFLIISACGFLYATLIYANATGVSLIFKIRGHKLKRKYAKKIWHHNKFEKCILLGTTISEYLGVYFLILSIPLVVNIVTENILLRVATLILVLSGVVVYHASGFSVMSRHFKCSHYRLLSIIIILEAGLFLGQFFRIDYLAYIFAGLLLLFILSLTIYIGINAKKLIENIGKEIC